MYEAVIAAVAGTAGIMISKAADAWRERRTRRESAESERKRIETDASGEWSRALLVDQATFRRDLLEHLEKHDARCDEKIAVAIARSEADCDEKINRKLRGQAAQLRAEFEQRLRETSEVIDD